MRGQFWELLRGGGGGGGSLNKQNVAARFAERNDKCGGNSREKLTDQFENRKKATVNI